MEKSFCFNSINGDRKYKAEDFREYFATFIGNGVFPNPSTNLQVIGENGDMTVTLKVGNGWINGALYINDNDLILPIDVADGVLNRIDRIVLRMDTVGRAINAKVKKGAFASSPVAPVLQRDADGYEIGIADIYIAAGATQITQANITDLRLNTSLCGIVHGTVEQVDTTTLFNQYLSWLTQKKAQYDADMLSWTAQKQTDFNTWYNNITSASQTEIDNMEADFQQDWDSWFSAVQNVLDGDTAGNLLNMINNLAGEGRTTETVKGNADDIASLEEEYNAHDMRAATGNILGHVKVDNDSVKIDSNGVISVRKPLDYGRYQAEFGLEDAELSYCKLNNGTAFLSGFIVTTPLPTATVNNYPTNSGYQYGERLDSTYTANIDEINYVDISLAKHGSPTKNVTLTVYDDTSKAILGSASVVPSNITVSTASTSTMIRFTFETPIIVTRGHVLQLRLYADTISDGTVDYYVFGHTTNDAIASAYVLQTDSTGNWSGTLTSITGADLYFAINYTNYHILSGTATKTVTPSDIKKWGNIKWTQNTPANTSVVCDVINKSFLYNHTAGTSGTAGMVYGTTQWFAQKFIPNKNSSKQAIAVKLKRVGTILSDLQVHVYNDNSGKPGTSLGNTTIPYSQIPTTESYVNIETNVNLVNGQTYYILFKTTSGDSGNTYYLSTENVSSGGGYSSDGGTSWSFSYTLTCSIEDEVIVKSNIQSLQDLSDIDVIQYPSLTLRWTLSRNSVEDSSPTVSDVSVTWEGKGYNGDGAWEKIADITLTSNTAQIDFMNLGLENYKCLRLIGIAKSTTQGQNLSMIFNDDTTSSYPFVLFKTPNTQSQSTNTSILLPSVMVAPSDTQTFLFETTISNLPNLIKSSSTKSGSTYFNEIRLQIANWNKTSQITKITLKPATDGLIATGSTFKIMGVK